MFSLKKNLRCHICDIKENNDLFFFQRRCRDLVKIPCFQKEKREREKHGTSGSFQNVLMDRFTFTLPESIPIDIDIYDEQAGFRRRVSLANKMSMRSCRKVEDEKADDAWLANRTSTRKPAKKATHEQRQQ